MLHKAILCLALGAALSAPATAQYVWRDAQGQRVYSDRPPPADVPASQRLRSPNAPAVPSSQTTLSAGPRLDAPGPSAKPGSDVADKEFQFRKRRLEQAETARKAEEAQTVANQNAAACSAARKQLENLESGRRIAVVNEQGEREFLDDNQRAARMDETRETLRKQCSNS